LGEHTGTHFDAPVHWVTGRELSNNTTDTLPVQDFVGPACVIDVSAEAAANHDFLLTPERIQAWEAQHGAIPAGSWVLLRTDWSKRTGPDFLNNSHTPGPTPDAMRYLANCNIKGFGVETVGTDAGQAGGFEPPFPAHNIMHGSGRYGLASLANLDQLPPTGSILVAAPLKIVQGSGSPVRVFALVSA
jgi:kynurenine formamidase